MAVEAGAAVFSCRSRACEEPHCPDRSVEMFFIILRDSPLIGPPCMNEDRIHLSVDAMLRPTASCWMQPIAGQRCSTGTSLSSLYRNANVRELVRRPVEAGCRDLSREENSGREALPAQHESMVLAPAIC
jgi:hypothetical protein